MSDDGDICEVVDNIFIGDYLAATNTLLLKSYNIQHVLSLDIVKPEVDSSLEQLYIEISDESTSNILIHLPSALAFIERSNRVLVHCRHGVSRSAAVIVAFLVSKKLTVEEALGKIQSVRPIANPNGGFIDQLLLWEEMNGRLDLTNNRYKYFLLQNYILEFSTWPDRTNSPYYKCKKCRRLITTYNDVIPHQSTLFPSWNLPTPTVNLCNVGIFVVASSWMPRSELLGHSSTRLLCSEKCGAKLGMVGNGVSCGCGAKGGRGIFISTNKLDKC